MPELPPFHLAIPVTDLARARQFYGKFLGCPEGRSTDEWVDFNFRGHQLVAHLVKSMAGEEPVNLVEDMQVPVRHFGLVLPMQEWQFLIEPRVRFRGQPGEQATMFLRDPFGNALEFKAFSDPGRLFAK
jgi:extradiol dioxygenase family protein